MDIEHLRAIIHRLHDSAVPLAEQKSLQDQLLQAQNSDSAWSYGLQLLSGQDRNSNVRFFGAHILASKLSKQWDTLAEEQRIPFKEALLVQFALSASLAYSSLQPPLQSERLVFRKLSLAVSALSFRFASFDWDDWLVDVVDQLTKAGCNTSGVCQFLLLVVEEEDRSPLSGKAQVDYESTLLRYAQSASNLFATTLVLSSDHHDSVNDSLNCLAAWTQHKYLPLEELTSLYPQVCSLLINPAHSIAACACLEELLSDSRLATPSKLQPLLSFFISPSINTHFESVIASEDADDHTIALFKLLCTVVESSASSLVEDITSPQSIQILRHLLATTTFPGHFGIDENFSDLALPIWEYLQEEISDSGIIKSNTQEVESRLPVVQELFQSLTAGLIRKIQWPVPCTWQKDVQEGFSDYRRQVGHTFLVIYYVLRSKLLELLLAGITTNNNPASLEAYLFAISALHEITSMQDDGYISSIFSENLFTTVVQHSAPLPQLTTTTLNLIEKYAPWLETHPELILPPLQYIVSHITQAPFSRAAALALAAVCDHCRTHLVPHVASFASLVSNLEGKIDHDDYVKVIGSVVAVLQAAPLEVSVQPFLDLLRQPSQAISSILSSITTIPVEASNLALTGHLKCLETCAVSFAASEPDVLWDDPLNGGNSVVDWDKEMESRSAYILSYPNAQEIQQKLSPLLQRLLELSATDISRRLDLAQSLSSFLLVLSKSHSPEPLKIQPTEIYRLLVQAIQIQLSAVWLATAERVLPLFDKAQNAGDVHAAIVSAFRIYLNSSQDIDSDPDIIQNFMEWGLTALSRANLAPNTLEELLLTSATCLKAQERASLQKTVSLLNAFVSSAAREDEESQSRPFTAILHAHGQQIIHAILDGVAQTTPQAHIEYHAELLLAFSRSLPDETRHWVNSVLGNDQFLNGRIPQEARYQYAKAIAATRTLRRMKEATQLFASTCR